MNLDAIKQRIPIDKLYHFAMGAAAALVTAALVLVSMPSVPLAAFLAGALLGAGYELVQKLRHEGVPSVADALTTAAGAATIAGLLAAFVF